MIQITEDSADNIGGSVQIYGKPTVCQLPTSVAASSITCSAWAPDISAFATGSFSGSLNVWSATGGHRAVLTQRSACLIRGVSFSPDSSKLAAISGVTLTIYGLRSGSPSQHSLPATAAGTPPFSSILWLSPDAILVGTETGQVFVFAPASGRFRPLTDIEGAICGAPVLSISSSPNSRCLVIGCANGNVLTVSTNSFALISFGRARGAVEATAIAHFGTPTATVVAGCSAGCIACSPALTVPPSSSLISFI